MNIRPITWIVAIVVSVCGWLVVWQVWGWVSPKPSVEMVTKEQAGLQRQLNYVQSQMDGLKKEVADLGKVVKIYKRAVLEAKGRVLNADQDIHRFVEAALKEEPVQVIKTDNELIKRSQALGITTVVVR